MNYQNSNGYTLFFSEEEIKQFYYILNYYVISGSLSEEHPIFQKISMYYNHIENN